MVIYKTINLLNGKFYIGKAEKNNPDYLGSGKILKLAILKNGVENFKKEIIDSALTSEELNDKEKYWIETLSATTQGYNITEGGTGGRTKFKTIYQYSKEGVFIKEWSSASEIQNTLRIDSSSVLKNCKGKLSSTKGFIWSYTYHEKIDKYNDPRNIKILQYNKNGELIKIWNSATEVVDETGISSRQLQLTLDKLNLTARNSIWLRENGQIKNQIETIKNGYFNNKNAVKQTK